MEISFVFNLCYCIHPVTLRLNCKISFEIPLSEEYCKNVVHSVNCISPMSFGL